MSIWRRVKNLFMAKLRSLRDSNDPREVLKENLQQMERYLQRIEKSRLELGREKVNMQRRIERLEETVADYQQEARGAVKIGEEQQARLALQEKYNALKMKERLEGHLQRLEDRIRSLERSKDILKNRIEIFRTKEVELDALRSASEAELRIHEITSGMSEGVFSNINEAVRDSEEKLSEIQAKITATREMMEEEGIGLEGLPEDLEEMDETVELEGNPEEELEELKNSLGEEAGDGA